MDRVAVAVAVAVAIAVAVDVDVALACDAAMRGEARDLALERAELLLAQAGLGGDQAWVRVLKERGLLD